MYDNCDVLNLLKGYTCSRFPVKVNVMIKDSNINVHQEILSGPILFQFSIYLTPILDVYGAPKLDTLFYSLTIKANSINYGKQDYYNPPDVIKYDYNKFKIPWKNINDETRSVTAQRRIPTSTMTITSLLNGFMGQNEYTTKRPKHEPTSIKYPESISKINSGQKNIGTGGKTLGDVLWGKDNSLSLPLSESTVTRPVTKSKPHRNGYSIEKLIQHDNTNNFLKLQQHSLIHPGYDYDDTICKIINKRILCGYNKNLGEIRDEEGFINLKDDCRMRADRIECGYSAGAYNLNNDPYKLIPDTYYRTRPDQRQGVGTPPIPTNNRENVDTLEKLVAMQNENLHHIIRSLDLGDGKKDVLRKYYSLSHYYQFKLREVRSSSKVTKNLER